jgi:hypothetical protein
MQADKAAQRLYDANCDFLIRLEDALLEAGVDSPKQLSQRTRYAIFAGWEAAWPDYAEAEEAES